MIEPFQMHGQATQEALEQCKQIIEAQGGKAHVSKPKPLIIAPESIESEERVHGK